MKNIIDGEKMRGLAEKVKSEIPNCGFALLVFEPDGENRVNYVSNVNDEFMIKALENQLNALKNSKTFPTPENLT
jgi:hypothetical protein